MDQTFKQNIPGDHERVFTVNITTLLEFEKVKADLVQVQGIEDATFHSHATPFEIIVFTDGAVTDAMIQEVVARHGFTALPKTFLIS